MPSEALASVIGKLREAEPALRRQFGVSGLWVFGSYVRGEQKPGSDLDLLIEFDGPGMTLLKFVDIELQLSGELGIRVDLVQRSALRPRLRSRILAEAVPV